VGATVHTALAAWWALPVEQRTVEAAGAEVDRRWIGLGFRDDAQEAVWRARAREMVESYVAGLDPHDEPVGVERTVATRTGSLALSGRIDRLDRRGDELVVVDYKTGRHVLSTDDARGSLALALYALAAGRTLHRECRRVELHHLPTGDVVVWEHTEDSLARMLARAEDLAAEARAAEDELRGGVTPERAEELFPPRPGSLCAWCDYAAHCPEGTAARPRALPWAGLAEDLSPPEAE
jgi:RecB family exonuclease